VTPDDKQPSHAREQTDESLRAERDKVDDALGKKLAAIEETADAVITRARERADEVLAAARANTDRRTRTSDAQSSEGLQQARVLEDEAVREERADADEVVRTERAERVALLSLERDETDRDLHLERTGSDNAVATRDEFLGVVSHDLRNMLQGMVGFAELIAQAESRENHGPEVLAYVQRIRRSATRMNRLIGDLVDVASIAAGVLAVTKEVGDPAAVLMEAVDNFDAQASAHGISLLAELPPSPPAASFDHARILQVLTNLLSNAIKFTPPNGKIVVRLTAAADELRFSVSDTGSGVPADNLDAVFGRFHQVTSNDRRGVGLGLYISKCIVQGHGGRIWAESRVGQGSDFHFTLPIHFAP
jgi:signal transduction histidine kinase